MPKYDIHKTPDYSPLVVHFTKDGEFARPDLVDAGHPLHGCIALSARDRLLNILKTKTIYASPMPYLPHNTPAVCFTECVWDALTLHADRYSPYGVVLNKRMIFKNGGGPALYVRGDVLKGIWNSVPGILEPFMTPFDPEGRLQPPIVLDWLDEREWRLPSDLHFEYADLEYVVVRSLKDAMDIVHVVGTDNLPEEKMIPIEVYRNIRRSWSTR